MEKDNHPRYVPKQISLLGVITPVTSVGSFPPGSHPTNGCCPIGKDYTAVEVGTKYGSRWFGFDKVWINSELRFVVQGFDSKFEEVSKWEKVDENKSL